MNLPKDCPNERHTWELRRKYTGVEAFPIRRLEVLDLAVSDHPIPYNSDQTPIMDDDIDLFPTVQSDASSDEPLDLLDEWLSCRYCTVEIRGERIQEVVYE